MISILKVFSPLKPMVWFNNLTVRLVERSKVKKDVDMNTWNLMKSLKTI